MLMTTRTRVAKGLLLLLLLMLAVTACGGSSGSGSDARRPRRTTPSTSPTTVAPPTTAATIPPTPTTTAPSFGSGNTPEEAIAAYLRTMAPPRGFAGDCAATDLARDIGKYCAALASPPSDTRTYSIGPVFSEITERLTVVRTGATWSVTAHVAAPRPGG